MWKFIALFLVGLLGVAHAQGLTGTGGSANSPSVTAIRPIQHLVATNGAASNGVLAITLPGTYKTNLITVGIEYCNNINCGSSGGVTISSVTSSAGETCSAASGTAGNHNAAAVAIWYCPNIAGGNDTITIEASGPLGVVFFSADVTEWTGIATSSPLDNIGNVSTGNGSSTTVSTSSGTAQSGELIYSVAIAVGQSPNPSAPLIPIQGNYDAYFISGAAGTQSATWTWSSATDFAVDIAAFKHS